MKQVSISMDESTLDRIQRLKELNNYKTISHTVEVLVDYYMQSVKLLMNTKE